MRMRKTYVIVDRGISDGGCGVARERGEED
jgi:hypothetical protein